MLAACMEGLTFASWQHACFVTCTVTCKVVSFYANF